MSRIVPVTGSIVMPEGHTYADGTWRYATEVNGGLKVAGGAIPVQFNAAGEVLTMQGGPLMVMVNDLGDFVERQPWAILEVRFRESSIGFEKRIPLVLKREEVSLRIDKQMTNAVLVQVNDGAVNYLNWRFDGEGYVIVDGPGGSLITFVPKAKYKGHTHTIEEVVNLKALLDSKASAAAVQQLQANKADLVNGKIPTSQLPGAALMEVFFVASEVAMLGLDAQPGDIAVRTDKGNLRFELTGDPQNPDHWSPQYPANEGGGVETGVLSLNGQRGDIILHASDVGAAPQSHTHTAAQITDFAGAVDARAQYNVAAESGIKATWDTANRRMVLGLDGTQAGFWDAVFDALVAGTGITVTQDGTGKPVVAVSGSGGWVDWNDVANRPTVYPAENHAARHRQGGPDALTAADIGAAAAAHTHTKSQIVDFAHTHDVGDIKNITTGSIPDLAEYIRDTIGAALAAGTGIKLTVNDPGDQIVIAQDSGGNTIIVEELDGSPRVAVSKIIVPNNTLTDKGNGVVQLTYGTGSSSGGTGGIPAGSGVYAPTYQRPLTVLNTTQAASQTQIIVVLQTIHAHPSGSDIRVFTANGSPVAHLVTNVHAAAGYFEYTLAFRDFLAASEQKGYIIKYGDDKVGYMYLTQQQLWGIARDHSRVVGQYTAAMDATLGLVYDTPNAGTTLWSMQDDAYTDFPLPNGNSVMFNGVAYTNYSVGANWGISFGGNPQAANSYTASNNGFHWGNQFDWYLVRLGFEIAQDGYIWHVTHAQYGQQSSSGNYIYTTIRYYLGGRWVMSTSKNGSGTTYNQDIRIGGADYFISLPPIDTTAPGSCITAVLDPTGAVTISWGEEAPITA